MRDSRAVITKATEKMSGVHQPFSTTAAICTDFVCLGGFFRFGGHLLKAHFVQKGKDACSFSYLGFEIF